jgi:uncharacterized RDD family membrane protein YckC
VLEKPLVRIAKRRSESATEKIDHRPEAEQSIGPNGHRPKQWELDLDFSSRSDARDDDSREQDAETDLDPLTELKEKGLFADGERPVGVSREIVLSRILAGIIDLTLPLLTALGLVFATAQILNFDFFEFDSLTWISLLSLVLFLFNSFFFLLTAGQTPGMYLTDLRLVGDQEDEVPFAGVLLRVVLFLPVAASLIGLLWALFDPLRRCVHDVLSGTRITRGE